MVGTLKVDIERATKSRQGNGFKNI